MPSHDIEWLLNAPDDTLPCTSGKVTGNGTTGHVLSDGEISSDDGLIVDKSKKKRKGDLTWSMMQGWETGEEALLSLEEIDKEIYELARKRMAVTELKPPPHDAKDSSHIAMWKLIREKRKDGGATLALLYRCPKRRCMAGLSSPWLDTTGSMLHTQCKQPHQRPNANSHIWASLYIWYVRQK